MDEYVSIQVPRYGPYVPYPWGPRSGAVWEAGLDEYVSTDEREALLARGYVSIQVPLATRLYALISAAMTAYSDLVGGLYCSGLETSKGVRQTITDTYGIRFRIHSNEAIIPPDVLRVWEWCQDKPWPRDGKPYRNWACAKAGQGAPADFASVLDTIHRMVGMTGVLAYIEKGLDLRDEPDAQNILAP